MRIENWAALKINFISFKCICWNAFPKQFLWASLLRKHYYDVFLRTEKKRFICLLMGLLKCVLWRIAILPYVHGSKWERCSFRLEWAPGELLDQTPHQHSIYRPCSGQTTWGFVKHCFEKMSWSESRWPLLSLLQCLAVLVRAVFLMSNLLLHFMTPQL